MCERGAARGLFPTLSSPAPPASLPSAPPLTNRPLPSTLLCGASPPGEEASEEGGGHGLEDPVLIADEGSKGLSIC